MNKTANLRWRITGCLAATALLAAGCTTRSADGPTSSGISASVSATPSVADVSPNGTQPAAGSSGHESTPESMGATNATDALSPNAQEAADRAAVEAQWRRFWIVYDGIVRTPKQDRQKELDSVAGPTLVANILKAADDADRQGIDNYGTWTHRLTWQFPIGGSSKAVVADCQDQSKTGTLEVKSGKILTVGKERSNMRGEFTRDSAGVWRLQQLYLLGDQEC